MKQKRYHSITFVAMAMIGTGLVMLGLLLFVYLGGSNGQAAAKSDFSSVPVEVNYKAPDLQLRDMNGGAVSLEMYRGKVVLVNLWATWCPPCKAEMPTLQSFYEEYKDTGFVVIAIDNGEAVDLVKPFVSEYDLTFPVWLDEDYVTEDAFGTISLPSSWVIDRAGVVRLSWVGEISSRVLEKYVPSIILE
jgi:cytochrome c biogenesis protein CcmG/thiol:disulfide interchange protein DsbE